MATNLSVGSTEHQFGTFQQQSLLESDNFSRHLSEQQSNNLIMINQFNIIDIHHHHHPQNYNSMLNKFKNDIINNNNDDDLVDKGMGNAYSQQELTPPPSSISSCNTSYLPNLSNNKMNDSMIQIDYACKLLAISADPYNWNQTDVHKWLMYQQRSHQLIPIFNKKTLENFQLDGMALCELTMQDFYNRILSTTSSYYSNGSSASWHCANILYNELNIWRTAITSMEPDLAFFDLEQSPQLTINNHYDFPFITTNTTTNFDNDSKLMDSYCSPASSPLSASCSYQMYSQGQQLPVQTDINVYGNEMIQTCSNNNASSSVYSSCSPSSLSSCSSSPCSPAGSSHSSMSPNTNYGNQQPNIQVNHITPEPNHLDVIKCGYFMSNNQCDAEINTGNNYYDCTVNVIHQQAQPSLYSSSHPQTINGFTQHQQTSDYGSDGGAISDDEMSDDGIEQFKLSTTTNHLKESFMQSNNYAIIKLTNSTSVIDTKCRSNVNINNAVNHRSHGSTSIQLWQFLKELLAQPHLYGTSIRWLERSVGVFKIEDSVRVARLWGQRKNRPAMNYDKLSRSIRQYYKKGIMKKTERAQRLVYQFCQPYGL